MLKMGSGLKKQLDYITFVRTRLRAGYFSKNAISGEPLTDMNGPGARILKAAQQTGTYAVVMSKISCADRDEHNKRFLQICFYLK